VYRYSSSREWPNGIQSIITLPILIIVANITHKMCGRQTADPMGRLSLWWRWPDLHRPTCTAYFFDQVPRRRQANEARFTHYAHGQSGHRTAVGRCIGSRRRLFGQVVATPGLLLLWSRRANIPFSISSGTPTAIGVSLMPTTLPGRTVFTPMRAFCEGWGV
jgi:hypothetical protein